MASVEHIRALHASSRRAAGPLQEMPLEQRADQIAAAARLLLDDATGPGAALRSALLESCGLSGRVIEYGLRTTLALFERETMLALHHGRGRRRGASMVVTILAGNVFSAAARPLLLPLLCGTPVLAKAASSDDVLPRFLQRALQAVDARLGDACAVTTFARGDRELESALLEGAEVLSVYGSDETVAELTTRLWEGTRLIARGHGLGAMFLSHTAMRSPAAARSVATRAALEIAAYDQRGCLSPHVAIVESGGEVDARSFSALLAEALDDVEHDLPRGPIDDFGASAQLQWRGVAAAIGELRMGDHWAVSYEAAEALRPSPGFRNVAVYEATDIADAATRLESFGPHLKALGVAGTAARHQLSTLAPYVCPIGTMQTPPLDAPLDGLHPLLGYCD
jgi:acyl-CoA reductase-like NAD-dependent aldehyde dehydrogenase